MIKGFDASHIDDINWQQLSDEFKFCFIKKSEGKTYTDPFYNYRSGYLPISKLVWGDYHFMQPGVSVEVQLDNYFNGRLATLPPILDAEVQGITPDMVKEWLAGAQQRSDKKPILYCDPGFYKGNLKSTEFDCYYWIAAWQPEPPHIHWDIWQYSEYGKQDGTHGEDNKYGSLDLDYFNGTIEQLANLS